MFSFNTQASNQTFEEERVVHICTATHTSACFSGSVSNPVIKRTCITIPCNNPQLVYDDSNDLASLDNNITNINYSTELSQLDLLLGISKVTMVKAYAGGVVYCSLPGGDYVWRDNNGHFYYMTRVQNTAGIVYLPTDLGSGIQGSAAAAVRCANQ